MTNRLEPAVLEERLRRLGISGPVADKIRAGGRCFIIGMGPSIAKVESEALKDELVIGVNHILRTHIKPDLICVSDASRLDTEGMAAAGPKCPRLITARHVQRQHADFLAEHNIGCFSDIEFVSLTTSVLDIEHFDPNLKRIYWTASVIGDLVVPLVAWLGMSDAYVLGLDGARASFPVTHAWGSDRVIGPHDSKLFHLHERAVELARRAGLRVWNASFGGVVAAFPKVALADVLPKAVARRPVQDPSGGFIVFRGRVLEIFPDGQDNDGTPLWRIGSSDRKGFIRNKNGTAIFERDNASDQFRQDSRFRIEPGFVRRDWLSICLPGPGAYICRWDERHAPIIRGAADLFSPYFSSFRLFENVDQAQSRLDTDRILESLETIRRAVGNLMIRNDSQ